MRRIESPIAEDEDEIDISPLIDCVFILLIFFIVTTVFEKEPDAAITKVPTVSEEKLLRNSIFIGLTADGGVIYGSDDIGVSGLQPLVRRIVRKEPDKPVVFKVDTNAPAELLVRCINEATLGGARRTSIASE